MGVEEKRRRIGRFIGLRGCESPLPSAASLSIMGLDLNIGEMGRGLKERESGHVDVDDDEDEDEDDEDAMEIDTDLDTGGQWERQGKGQQKDQQEALSKVMSSPTMAMGNEEPGISAYISELLRSTTGTTDEDIAETERRIRRAEDELDEIRRKMGWYF